MGNIYKKCQACAILVFCLATSALLSAQTFKDLLNFDGADGYIPAQALVQGVDGNFYGTTAGGDGTGGSVFKITPAGTLTTLHNFCTQTNCPDGSVPGGLLLGGDGNFYGVTYSGGANGAGTFYRITSSGELTTLYSFCSDPNCTDGYGPDTKVIQGSDGNFYGVTQIGGTSLNCNSGCGTIFKVTSAGKLTTLHSFDFTDGWIPNGVIEGSDGNIYGTTSEGGANCASNAGPGCGTVFKITPAGKLTTLYNFCAQPNCADGQFPSAGLVEARDGNFYGTVTSGGTECNPEISPCGTLFKITSAGAFTLLHTFDLTDGANPAAPLIQATDGMFYGTTWYGGDTTCNAPIGCGTVYRMSSAGSVTVLHNFENTDGSVPDAPVFQATTGVFYGNTSAGGNFECVDYEGTGCGTVFSLNTNLAPFVAFIHNSGKVGQAEGVLGQGFTGTTSVFLNGVPAEFKVLSDTLLGFAVPAGAKSGNLKVKTSGGTLISNLPFFVLP